MRKLSSENFWYLTRIVFLSSKSVSSIDSGPIFYPRLDQDLSRKINSLCRFYSLGESYLEGKVQGTTPENRDFNEFSTFLESWQEASRQLLGNFWSVRDCVLETGVPGCQGARVRVIGPRALGGSQDPWAPGCQGVRVAGCQGVRVPGCERNRNFCHIPPPTQALVGFHFIIVSLWEV